MKIENTQLAKARESYHGTIGSHLCILNPYGRKEAFMGEKDKVERSLVCYPDIFADDWNGYPDIEIAKCTELPLETVRSLRP